MSQSTHKHKMRPIGAALLKKSGIVGARGFKCYRCGCMQIKGNTQTEPQAPQPQAPQTQDTAPTRTEWLRTHPPIMGGAAIVANTGSNAWNTNGAWVGGVQPTAADDVTIPSAANVTVPSAVTGLCRSLTVATGGTLTFAATTSAVNIGTSTPGAGNVAFSNAGTITLTGVGTIRFVSTSATQQTITTGGQAMPAMTWSGAGGSWILTDAMTLTGAALISNGTWSSGNQTITENSSFTISGSPTVSMGSTVLTMNSSFTNSATCVWSAGTGTIRWPSNSGQIFAGAGLSYNIVTMGVVGGATISGTNTIATLTLTNSAIKTAIYTIANSQTITGTLTITGNSATNRILIQSSVAGTQHTLTAAVTSLTNVDFQDTAGAGAATWTGTSIGDALGNSGITFTAAVTRYASGTGTNWSNTANWASVSGGATGASVPLVHDAVILDALSPTMTIDMPRACRDLDCTSYTHQLNSSVTGGFFIFGNITLGASMTSFLSNNVTGAGRGAQTFTTNGKTFNVGFSAIGFGGTYTLQDNYTASGSLTVGAGTTLQAAPGIAVSVTTLNASGSAATLNLGSSTWTLTGTGTVVSVGAATFVVPGTSTIVLSDVSATAKTFAGASKTFGNLTVAAGGGAVTITGNNTWNIITINAPKTILTGAASTQTFANLIATGSSGNTITFNSVTAGTAYNWVCAGGIVSLDWCVIKDCHASGGAIYYAGKNSTLVSNDTGFIADSWDGNPGYMKTLT